MLLIMRRVAKPERSRVGPAADRHASELARKLGMSLLDARRRARLTQAKAAAKAGLSQSAWSRLETEADPRYTLATWDRAAFAVGTSLNAYLPESTAAGAPRDAVHLKAQELVIRMARAGGWHGTAEVQIDREARSSRFADVLLARPRLRPSEVALIEVIDWFDDVGSPLREWPRRLEAVERQAIARMVGEEAVPRVSGCWLVRATRRNRALIGQHQNLFRSRFSGSGRAWLSALTDPTRTMPEESALLWVAVSGDRLFALRWS
jgi:transcriptional regulator with XRE-family HTH domain